MGKYQWKKSWQIQNFTFVYVLYIHEFVQDTIIIIDEFTSSTFLISILIVATLSVKASKYLTKRGGLHAKTTSQAKSIEKFSR